MNAAEAFKYFYFMPIMWLAWVVGYFSRKG